MRTILYSLKTSAHERIGCTAPAHGASSRGQLLSCLNELCPQTSGSSRSCQLSPQCYTQLHSWKQVNMASISTDEERTDEEALLFVLLVRRRRRLAAEFGKEIGLEDGREGSIWHVSAELDRPHTRGLPREGVKLDRPHTRVDQPQKHVMNWRCVHCG